MSHRKENKNSSLIPLAKRGNYVADDPYILELDSAPWEILATPIDQKPFLHWKEYLITPSVIMYLEGYESTVRFIGQAPVGMLAITLPMQLGGKSSYWNSSPRSDGVHAVISGNVDAVFDAGQTHIMILIEVNWLRRKISNELIEALERAAKNRFVHTPQKMVKQLTQWICNVLDETAKQPTSLLHNVAIDVFEDELIEQLLHTLQLEKTSNTRPPILLRQKGLNQALNYLKKTKAPNISVPELCSIANVSQRTLEYAFKEAFSLTPKSFLRLRRFHFARHDLMAASPKGKNTIANIAHQNGFIQLGRFAKEYRKIFGELPSDTYQCSYPKILQKSSHLLW